MPHYLSTYLGGSDIDVCNAITLDKAGNIYVTGNTVSPNFPTTPSSYNTSPRGASDVFVVKFDKEMKTILASALIGGVGKDVGASIICDTQGHIYVAGFTGSSDFPVTSSAYSTKYSGGARDVFVLEMDSNLTTLIASTYLGGSGEETGAMVMDNVGRLVIAGTTSSTDFPVTPGALGGKYNGGSNDMFVATLDPDLKKLRYSTYIGGSSDDHLNALGMDRKTNELCIAGRTSSANYPVTENAYKQTSDKFFITKVSPDLSKLTASTFYMGWIYCLLVDKEGDVYVGGHTSKVVNPTANAYCQTFDKYLDQGYISSFHGDLSRIEATTLLPGSWAYGGGSIVLRDLAQSPEGEIVVVGTASPKDFPTTPGAFDETHNGGDESEWGGDDIFVLKMNRELSALLASTFVGGGKSELPSQVAVDGHGSVYIAGYTSSENFPTSSSSVEKAFNGGESDAIIARLDKSLASDVSEEFQNAAKVNDLNTVKRMLAANGDILEKTDQYKRAALHSAARYGALEVAQYLVDRGANVKAIDESGNTPLHLAFMYGHDQIVRLLCKDKADIDVVNNAGQTPLYLGTYYGTNKVVESLLSMNADINRADKYGYTPLHIAALSEKSEKLNLLLAHNPALDAKNGEGKTALHLATQFTPDLNIIETLIDHGADLSVTDNSGSCAILLAATGRKEKLELLLKKGANVNSQDSDGNTVLHGAILNLQRILKNPGMILGGSISDITTVQREKMRMLLEYGADPNLKNNAGQSPLDIANEIADKELIDILSGQR